MPKKHSCKNGEQDKIGVVKMDKVSVIMPCFNDGLYIKEAIASVLNQTYQNIEIVIIDDGSDDPITIQIINEIDDTRIKVLHSKRLRPAGARNYGIREATGKYILPVDSDDKIEPTYIEKAVDILEHNHDIGVVYCYADLFGVQSGRWQLPDYDFRTMLLDNIVFVTAMFYKEDWELVGGFNTKMKAGMEDYDFWLSLLEIGREIHQIPEVLFHYRIKPISRTTQFQDDCTSKQETYRQIYYNHPKLYEKYRDEYAIVLRDALIEQVHLRQKYEKSFEIVAKLNNIPVFNKIIKRIIK